MAASETPQSMVERMTLIMGAFDGASPWLSLQQIADRSGLPRSTVHRILESLCRLRWLDHTGGHSSFAEARLRRDQMPRPLSGELRNAISEEARLQGDGQAPVRPP